MRFAHKQLKNYFKFAMLENLRIFQHCLFTGRGRDGKRHLSQARQKKAPEGGLAATLRGKKVRSFLLFGVPDLECYCDVAVSAVRPDNNAKLCPAAIALHVNICSGQFLADFFLNLLQDLINN